jgi:hypothetical protein
LFNFHSWMPGYFDVDSYDIQPGFSFISQNLLGTAETSFGYKWDITEKTGKVYGKFIYKGFYPVFSTEVANSNRSTKYLSITNYINNQNEIVRSDTIMKRLSWNETILNFNTYIPFNFTSGEYYRLLQPELKCELTSRNVTGLKPDWFVSGIINTISYRLYFHQILRKSFQDLVPNQGVIIDLVYRHSPGSKLDIGNLFCFQMVNYLPGFMRNHGFVIYNGFQKRTINDGYAFNDVIKYPRWWGKELNNTMYSFSADYKLPLLYPDLNLGKLLYLKRVKASIYADYAYLIGDTYNHGEIVGQYKKSISGYGTEITGDMHFFRIYAPVNAGIRVGYLPVTNQIHYGFLFSVDFTSF